MCVCVCTCTVIADVLVLSVSAVLDAVADQVLVDAEVGVTLVPLTAPGLFSVLNKGQDCDTKIV